MALAQRSGRSRHRLILLVLTAITLLTVDLRGFGPAESAQRVVRDVLDPVTDLAATIFSPVSDAWNSVFDYGDLESENEALRRELDELRGEALRAEADRAAYQRLLEAVDLPYIDDIEIETATVKRGAVGNFASNVVTIDKGRRQGIRDGMAVVTGAGLVGAVDRADGATATIRLLTDPGLLVGVRLVSTGDVGLGHAVAGEPGLFVIDQGPTCPDSDDPSLLPEIGSPVVTDTTSRYPADIPVGIVTEVPACTGDEPFEVLVELSAQVDDVQWVTVLLTEQSDEPPLSEVVPATSVPLDFDPALLDPDPEPDTGEEGG